MKTSYGAFAIKDGKYFAKINDIKLFADSKKELDIAVHKYRYGIDEEYANWYDSEMSDELKIEKVKSDKISFGAVSLVGFFGDIPLKRGNYFSMNINGKHVGVINMWYENLKEAIKRFGIKELEYEIFNGGVWLLPLLKSQTIGILKICLYHITAN